jgi:hypothetical protein
VSPVIIHVERYLEYIIVRVDTQSQLRLNVPRSKSASCRMRLSLLSRSVGCDFSDYRNFFLLERQLLFGHYSKRLLQCSGSKSATVLYFKASRTQIWIR